MRDIEGIEKVLEKLRPHWEEIDKQFEIENKKFKSLLGVDYDRLGRLLQYHLIVENYLERFLTEHYLIEDIAKVRLSFAQKANLLPDKAYPAAFVKLGIINLNSIRNKYAHRLNYDLQSADIMPIREILKISNQNVEFEDPLNAVERFTTLACTWLSLPPPHLQKIFIDAFSEISVNIRE